MPLEFCTISVSPTTMLFYRQHAGEHFILPMQPASVCTAISSKTPAAALRFASTAALTQCTICPANKQGATVRCTDTGFFSSYNNACTIYGMSNGAANGCAVLPQLSFHLMFFCIADFLFRSTSFWRMPSVFSIAFCISSPPTVYVHAAYNDTCGNIRNTPLQPLHKM